MKDLFTQDGAEAIDLPDGEVLLHRQPDLGDDPAQLFDVLRYAIAWREESIVLFGKPRLQPRLLAWYGDAGASYIYSGVRHEPLPWIPVLDRLRRRVEAIAGAPFNSVLANLYRDNRDSMGLHADDEPELGLRPIIASLSLGEERVFRLKHRTRDDVQPRRLPLPSGSLLIMRGTTQQHWKHEVPKQRRPCGARINLTFRQIDARRR